MDDAQLFAFAGREWPDGFSVVSLGPIERVRQILILLPGRRLPIGRCISMMPRDKIDPNDAEELGRNGHCRCIYDIYVRVNRTTTTPTSRTFPQFIVRSNDSFTAIIFTISFALLRLRSERKYSFSPANDLIYLKIDALQQNFYFLVHVYIFLSFFFFFHTNLRTR